MSKPSKKEEIEEDAKELISLLKKSGLFKSTDGPEWRLKHSKVPEHINFEDSKIDNFVGYSFVNKENGKIYLNPPKELLEYLQKEKKRLVKNEDKIKEYEEKYGPNIFYGFYKLGSTKQSTIEKLEKEIENDDEVEFLTNSEIKEWAQRKVAQFLLHETGTNFQPLLACILSQTQDSNHINSDSANELAEILESIRSQKTGIEVKETGTSEKVEVEKVEKVEKTEKDEKVKKYDNEEDDSDEKLTKLKKDLVKYERMLVKNKDDSEKIVKIEKIIKTIKKEISKIERN